MSTLDLIGKKFKNLTVLYRKGNSKRRQSMWMCACDCGNTTGWSHSHFFHEAFYPDECEIIGNAYENPELLEKQEE